MGGLDAVTNGLVWTFTAASVFMVTLRLIARLHLTKAGGWDDTVIVIALIINVLSACLASYAVSQGVGQPLDTLSDQQAIQAAKWGAIADAFALMSFTVPKLSVAILLSRILSVLLNSFAKRFTLLLPAIVCIAWSIGNEGFWFGQCHPVQALWDKSIPGSSCLNPLLYQAQGIALCAVSAATDYFYALFPILFVTKLNMSLQKKINLSCMLGLGVVGGSVAIWKTTQFLGISMPNADVTEASAHLIYATLIEANLLIVSACIPTVLPVIRALNIRTSRAHSSAANLSKTRRPRTGGSLPGDDPDPRGRRGFPAWRRPARLAALAALDEADEADDSHEHEHTAVDELAIARAVTAEHVPELLDAERSDGDVEKASSSVPSDDSAPVPKERGRDDGLGDALPR